MRFRRTFCHALLVICLPALAAAQDARPVVAAAARAMGLDGVTSLYYYGSGASYSIGQNNNPNGPWPKTPLNEYTRAIDFAGPTTRATWTTFATPVTGGAPALANAAQDVTTTSPWGQKLEIWITPWGFLKGAAAGRPTLSTRTVGGKRFQVVTWDAPATSPGGKAYQLVGYINADQMVEKVETRLDHPVFGDMLVEAEYTFYRDNNGLKYPSEIVQKRAGWPVFDLQVLGAFANPSKLAQLMSPMPPAQAAAARGVGAPAGAPAAGGNAALLPPGVTPAPGAGNPLAAAAPGPAGAPGAAAAPPPPSEKLADGVYRIRGAYNSLAVEFADHILLIEPGPMNEARALQGIAETKKLFPSKPIRYGVPTHHHIDHTGGIAAAASEGMTLVVPEVSKAFFDKALSAPRTLAPDALAKSGKKAVVEGFKGDKRVFQDATRTVEIHVIKGLPHADGLVVAWLPKEKLLVYADMFNFPTAAQPVPNPPVVGTMVFVANLDRLGIDPVSMLSVHNMNPDRLVTMKDLRDSLGSNKL